jgi:PST family polysaccharide transporter
MTDPKRESRELDHALVKGVAWTGAASWIAQALSWLSTLVVVRLLSPDDYGLVALATVYLGLATMLSEFGIGTAVVTLRDLTRRQLAELNMVALLFALTAMLISIVAAPFVAKFFGSSRMVTLIWVMSLALPIGALGSVSHALLQKELEFRFLATVQIIQSLSAALTTLILAVLGADYWALALGPALGQTVLTALIVIRQPTGLAWPSWPSLGPVLQFSRQIITERLAWYGYSQADKLVIGRWIGEVSTGLYSVASTFGLIAVEKVTVLMLRVAPAVFSAVQNDATALRRYLLSMTEAVAIVTFPVSIGLALVAEDFVVVLLGEPWIGAVVPLQFLAVYAAFQSVSPLLNRVLAVIHETRFNMNLAVATFIVLPIAFILSTRWGLTGIAAAWLVVPLLQLPPIYLRLHRRIGLRVPEYLVALWPALSSVAVMSGAVLLLQAWSGYDGLSRVMGLVSTILVGAVAYAGTILLVHGNRVRAFRELMAEMRVRQESAVVVV